jgi:hypothetical protein
MEQQGVMGWSHTSGVGEGSTVRQVMSAPVHSAAPDTGVTQLVIPRKGDADLIPMPTRRLPGVVTVKSAITYDQDDKSCRLTPGISGFVWRPGLGAGNRR